MVNPTSSCCLKRKSRWQLMTANFLTLITPTMTSTQSLKISREEWGQWPPQCHSKRCLPLQNCSSLWRLFPCPHFILIIYIYILNQPIIAQTIWKRGINLYYFLQIYHLELKRQLLATGRHLVRHFFSLLFLMVNTEFDINLFFFQI